MVVISGLDSRAAYLCDWANHLLDLLKLDFKTLLRSQSVCQFHPRSPFLCCVRACMGRKEHAQFVFTGAGDLPSWNTEALERNGTLCKARQNCGTESFVNL